MKNDSLMTDHAKALEEIALKVFGSKAYALLLRAATELRRLQKLVDDCAHYLQDGETPAQCIDRTLQALSKERVRGSVTSLLNRQRVGD